MKRIIIATLAGLLSGLFCFWLASGSGELPLPVGLQIIIGRTLLGFAIGISSLRMGHWSIHGIVMGLLFSITMALSGLMAPENPEFTPQMMFVATIVMGIIYGFLIELITTAVFGAKQIRK